MSDYTEQARLMEPEPEIQARKTGTLYLRLSTRDEKLFGKIRAILGMFPGNNQVVVYFADTKQRLGSTCTIDSRMVPELERVLGKDNVVIK